MAQGQDTARGVSQPSDVESVSHQSLLLHILDPWQRKSSHFLSLAANCENSMDSVRVPKPNSQEMSATHQ